MRRYPSIGYETIDIEDSNEEENPPSKKRAAAENDDKKAIHREKVRINEQKRRGRLKEYYTKLKQLLPPEQQNADITKEETLLQAINLLQSLQARSNSPFEKVAVPRLIALSNTELSDAFKLVHRDVYHKVFGINSNESRLAAIGVCNYLCDLAKRCESEKLLLHGQVCLIAIYGFVAYNPSMSLSIFSTLVPLYEKLVQDTPLIQIRPTLGGSEWVLISYALVLGSIGKFDLSAVYEKRALQLASKHPEIAQNVYANLYFTKFFRGESLSVTEALEAYHCMKKVSYYRDYGNLAFALSLLHQNNASEKQKLEAVDIFERSEGAILACPYFEFQIRAIFIEMYQTISPARALKEAELALLLIEKCGRSGCLTKADFLRLKADTLLCIPHKTVEELVYNHAVAEELYKEVITLTYGIGLHSCALKAGWSLCKLYRMQRRTRETMELARYLMELLLRLEKENENPPKLMRDVREFLDDLCK